MKARFFTFLGSVGLALAVLTSCSDAIFATIETEKRVATNTLPLLLSIFDLAVTAPGTTYYVAAGAVFKGELSGVGGTVTWTPNTTDTSRPFNPPGNPICNAMAFFLSRLYGGFITTTGSALLYQSGPGPDFSFAAGQGNMVPMLGASAGEQITLLKSVDPLGTPVLYIGGATAPGSGDYVYQLDYSLDGTTWLPTTFGVLPKPIVGVGFASALYWAASGSTVYTSASSDFTGATVVGNTGIGTDTINGLFADTPNGFVFVTTKANGVFYTNTGGASWFHIGADVPPGSSDPASCLTVAGPVDSGNRFYLVGTDGFGYYTLDTLLHTWTRFPDTTILLYTSSVSRILVDGSNVLLGTNLNGLWRGVFDPSTGQVLSGTNQYWIHE